MTKKQLDIIKHLADGYTEEETAKLVKCSRQYVSKVQNERDYALTLALSCVDRLNGLLPQSISKLQEIITAEGTENYSVQVQAIRLILEYAKLNEIVPDKPQEMIVSINYE